MSGQVFGEGDLRRVAALVYLAGALSSCSVDVARPAYVVHGEAAGALGFVRTADGWLLLQCHHERDWRAYHHDQEQNNGSCRAAVPRAFTETELIAAQQRLAADLQRGTGERAAQIGFAATLAALSLLISRAIVTEVRKVVPITVAVGFGLYHAQRKVQQIVSMQRGKETALLELRAPQTRHHSSVALSSVEEVLLRYLTSS